MQLKSCKKTYNNETQRAVPLDETLARIEPEGSRGGNNPGGGYHEP